jgi:uncharacterized lipoprotein YmbA
LVALVIATLACGRVPPMHYYVLEPSDLTGRAAVGPAPTVGVDSFSIDPPYDQDRIVYRLGRDSPEIGFYAYHRWAAPLETMLPRVVAAELDRGTPRADVVLAEPGGTYAARVLGHLIALEEVDTAEGQTVRLRLRLSLALPDGRRPWTETLSAEAAATTDSVAVIVERMRDVLREVLAEARPAFALAVERLGSSRQP